MPRDLPSNEVSRETILYFTHELTRTKRAIDEANSAHRQLVKQAKSEGVPVKAVLQSIALARQTPDQRRAWLADQVLVEALRYPESKPLLDDMFGNMNTDVSREMHYKNESFDAEQQGYIAGKYGAAIEDCPFLATAQPDLRDAWHRSWHNGSAAAHREAGPDIKPADTRKSKQRKKILRLPGMVMTSEGPKRPRRRR
jgi:ribosome modulation factor